jgi:hypothetical protein
MTCQVILNISTRRHLSWFCRLHKHNGRIPNNEKYF